MRLFKADNGTFLVLSKVIMVTPIESYGGENEWEPDMTHVVCLESEWEHGCTRDEYERLMAALESM